MTYQNDKVCGLFLRPFPRVTDAKEIYQHKYVVEKQIPWYLVEVSQPEKQEK